MAGLAAGACHSFCVEVALFWRFEASAFLTMIDSHLERSKMWSAADERKH